MEFKEDEENVKKKRQILKEFIQLYESFPCLWRIKSREYHDREMRSRAYKVLARKLQQIQPDADRAAVVRKINCLRSNIRKEKRKSLDRLRTGRVYKTKLWYYPLFGFLNGTSRRLKNESEGLEGMEAIKIEGNTDDPLGWQCNNSEQSPAAENYPRGDATEELCESTYGVETLHKTVPESSFVKQQEDRHDVFGKNVAMKLRHINLTSDTQRIMAEKIINEALYMAEMGLLTMEHCKK